jgi:hypothetical protein
VRALETSSSLGGCTDFSPEELSSEELLESDELELSLESDELELLDSELSVSAELSLCPSLSSSGLSLSSSLDELSPAGAGSVSSPAGGGSLPSMDSEELSPLGAGSLSLLESELELSSLEESLEESESDLFSSSSNMAQCSPQNVGLIVKNVSARVAQLALGSVSGSEYSPMR